MHPEDYRESLRPPQRDWDAENDQERDDAEGDEFDDENNQLTKAKNENQGVQNRTSSAAG